MIWDDLEISESEYLEVNISLKMIYDDNEYTETKTTYNDIKEILGNEYDITYFDDDDYEILIDFKSKNDVNFPFNEKFQQTELFDYLEQFPFVITYYDDNDEDVAMEMRYMIGENGEKILDIVNIGVGLTIKEHNHELNNWITKSERALKIKKIRKNVL